jgi:hypothetical protein
VATKMTFGEWCGAVLIGGTAGIVIYVVFLPLGLLMAWMRVKMWDWFIVPYFHLPHVSVWLMYGIVILFTSIAYNPNPELKNDLYKASQAARIAMPFAVQFMGFLVAYLIHVWALKG